MKINKLQELNSKELEDVNGGAVVLAAIGIALGVIAIGAWVASEWDCLTEGYVAERK